VLAGFLAGLAVAVLLSRPAVGLQRLAGVVPRPARPAPALGPAAACAVAGVAVAVLVGLPAGLVPGLAVVAGVPRLLSRLEPRELRLARTRLAADLPLALDLLAACLTGGAGPAQAAAAVAEAIGGPAGQRLGAVAAALAVGSSPAEAWAELAGREPGDLLAPAARMLARAAEGGAPVAATVQRLAADARAAARSREEQAARRLGVLVVAPLGLCFLPAFVLLGVVPVVIGLAGPLLTGL